MSVFLGEAELNEKADHLEKHRSELLRKHYLEQVTAFPAVRKLFQQLLADGKKIGWPRQPKKTSSKGIRSDLDRRSDPPRDLLGRYRGEQAGPRYFQAAMKRLGDIQLADILVVGDNTLRLRRLLVKLVCVPSARCAAGFPRKASSESSVRLPTHKSALVPFAVITMTRNLGPKVVATLVAVPPKTRLRANTGGVRMWGDSHARKERDRDGFRQHQGASVPGRAAIRRT